MLDYTDLLGKRFEYGGRGPDKYDCYGLVKEIYRRVGIELPEYVSSAEFSLIHQMINQGKELFTEIPEPEALCVVTFRIHPRYTTHLGVVLEDEVRFIHILQKTTVAVERLDSPTWKRRVTGYWRWKGLR